MGGHLVLPVSYRHRPGVRSGPRQDAQRPEASTGVCASRCTALPGGGESWPAAPARSLLLRGPACHLPQSCGPGCLSPPHCRSDCRVWSSGCRSLPCAGHSPAGRPAFTPVLPTWVRPGCCPRTQSDGAAWQAVQLGPAAACSSHMQPAGGHAYEGPTAEAGTEAGQGGAQSHRPSGRHTCLRIGGDCRRGDAWRARAGLPAPVRRPSSALQSRSSQLP